MDANDKVVTAADMSDIDNILGDLEISGSDDADIEELIEAVDQAAAGIEVTDIDTTLDDLTLDESDLRKVEATVERQEAYEEQESVIAAPIAPTQTVVKAAKTPRAPSAPRVARDLNSLAPEHFQLEVSTAPLDEAALDQIKTDTLKLIPTQKKVAEKFENLFTTLAANRAPSTFVVMAFNLLEKTGVMSSTELVAAYKTVGAKSDTEGYNEGTARSQAGQIMNLFDAVKIATRTKQSLELNANSAIAAKLRTVLNTAP